jgi:hypothetical protein
MRTPLLAIIAGAGLLFSAAALADETQATAPMQTAAANSTETLICRAQYHEGMVLKRAAQCHTQRWWDQNRYLQQQELRQIQIRGDLQL